MIRNILVFLITSLIGFSIFIGCAKDEYSSDITAPTVEIIHPSRDTVIWTDTFCVFRARFTDEGGSGLSAYSVKIWNARMAHETDTFTLKSTLEGIGENEPDSVIFNKSFPTARISGSPNMPLNDTTIYIFDGYKVDSMRLSDRTPTLLGKHWFKVSVIDKAGNMGVDSFQIEVEKYIPVEHRDK